MTRAEAERRVIEAARHVFGDEKRLYGETAYRLIELQEALNQMDALPADGGWRPIESAPKDETRVLLLLPPDNIVSFGRWNDDRYSNRPRPYWSNERDYAVTLQRARQPKFWLPLDLPSPPDDGEHNGEIHALAAPEPEGRAAPEPQP